ncbi:hypothetical protein [Carnobacterium maltaromaticum]|jgi:hypothetical protein|uniref:Uncharacterized protein n=1 Tax=Carnobacterium maltaromaticum LMA28 TaxID=1234679 RepID=K8E6X5_CARML|nr:hypothetical protein [Carnobacterium maltaromaticum]AOA03179.1 hypothetical protein BFC23_11975 [Carnobacterium maltaromaticum]KRN62045.1 hypothetical protein IV70_GL000139 [Carnobacterium maltaromaticum DSM 20342]MCI1818671.1 hypothetical protein [Carnobacterium maltaromaticum]CCO12617.2 hypothetical protein BN424_3196 [Carnobacterium maltaromaticum LMA28]
MEKMTKSAIPPIPYFSAGANRLNELFIRLALLNQLFGKKMNGKNDKKSIPSISYFSFRAISFKEHFIIRRLL